MKLFEQEDEWDPFGEESQFSELFIFDNFEFGDVVVILNNNHMGNFPIGSLGTIVEKFRIGYMICGIDKRNGMRFWYKGDGDIRKATQEEIIKGEKII
jgi:hypothetical protein